MRIGSCDLRKEFTESENHEPRETIPPAPVVPDMSWRVVPLSLPVHHFCCRPVATARKVAAYRRHHRQFDGANFARTSLAVGVPELLLFARVCLRHLQKQSTVSMSWLKSTHQPRLESVGVFVDLQVMCVIGPETQTSSRIDLLSGVGRPVERILAIVLFATFGPDGFR
jgi:hypothetical protein